VPDMSSFTLKIKLGNDAMSSSDDIIEALSEVTNKLSLGKTSGMIYDLNGNSVGEFKFTR
jgi:hypothetical protein